LARACDTIAALSDATGVEAGSGLRKNESAEYGMKGPEVDPAVEGPEAAGLEEPAVSEPVVGLVTAAGGAVVAAFGFVGVAGFDAVGWVAFGRVAEVVPADEPFPEAVVVPAGCPVKRVNAAFHSSQEGGHEEKDRVTWPFRKLSRAMDMPGTASTMPTTRATVSTAERDRLRRRPGTLARDARDTVCAA
jgi:hypothetical protein